MTRDEVLACAVLVGPPLLTEWPEGIPCPAMREGGCQPGRYEADKRCGLWRCDGCRRWVPWCVGGCGEGYGENEDMELCDECAAKSEGDASQ